MRFSKILLVCLSLAAFGGLGGPNAGWRGDGGAPLPTPPQLQADGGAPLPTPPAIQAAPLLTADGGAPLPTPPLA
jgi:hypothetical protein